MTRLTDDHGGGTAGTASALVGQRHRGSLIGTKLRIGVAASRFNHLVVDRLVEGALDALERHGCGPGAVDLAWVPGAFELPLAATRLGASGRYDAVVCLGAIIRGATSHYDLVANQCASGILRAQLDTGIPVIFGVLTTETIEQAIERSGTKAGNAGAHAAASAIEMANLLQSLSAVGAEAPAGRAPLP